MQMQLMPTNRREERRPEEEVDRTGEVFRLERERERMRRGIVRKEGLGHKERGKRE